MSMKAGMLHLTPTEYLVRSERPSAEALASALIVVSLLVMALLFRVMFLLVMALLALGGYFSATVTRGLRQLTNLRGPPTCP